MAKKIIPDSLREVLNYDPDTGELTWAVDASRNIKAGTVAGNTRKDGYRSIRYKGVPYLAHRVAWFLAHGEQPDEIDHINRVTSDNRLCNLRSVDARANSLNREVKGAVRWKRGNRAKGYNYTYALAFRGRQLYHGPCIFTAYFRLEMEERRLLPLCLPKPQTS